MQRIKLIEDSGKEEAHIRNKKYSLLRCLQESFVLVTMIFYNYLPLHIKGLHDLLLMKRIHQK
jgi:hypothetical protein